MTDKHDLFEKVVFSTNEQRKELDQWCRIIGHKRYLKYIPILEAKYKDQGVPFDILRECVIYDNHLNTALYSVFRTIELSFKNECGERKKELFSKLADKVKTAREENGTLMGDHNFDELKNLRNMTMHHEIFINSKDFGRKVKNALFFIEDDRLRQKKIREINKLAEYDEKGKQKTVTHYCIHIEEQMTIKINSIDYNGSLVNGPGVRALVFLQGCHIRCEGCHNAVTWDEDLGVEYDVAELAEELKKKIKNKKITITGGEPFFQTDAVTDLVRRLHNYNFDICLYTGCNRDEVPRETMQYLKYIKVGKYKQTLRCTTKPYIGSTNQEFIKI